MAPNATAAKTRIQVLRLVRSAQSSVGSTMPARMSRPPMVGVPAFFWCPFGPSSRMYWPICITRRRSIIQGPSTSTRKSAVRLATAVRKVM